MSNTAYMTARDVMRELNVSQTKAYEILRECTRVVSGRSVRVSRQAFDAWKAKHTVSPVDEYPRGSRLPTVATSTAPSHLLEMAAKLERAPPIKPRTKPRKNDD